jgi:hypothetical protein
MLMLPVAVHVPGVCVVAVAADIPVTNLLNPTKASRTPIEQRAKPIKTRGLKKADREVDFVFIEVIFFCSFLFSLRVLLSASPIGNSSER